MNHTTTLYRLRYRATICLASAIALTVAATAVVSAQQDSTLEAQVEVPPSLYIGLFGGYQLNSHTVTLSPTYFFADGGYPEGTSFGNGDGNGLNLGALVEYPFSVFFAVGLRLGYMDRSGTMPLDYVNSVDVVGSDGSPVTATVHGELQTTLGYLNLTPHVKITPASLPLYAIAGIGVLYPISTDHQFIEVVTNPADGLFVRTDNRGRLVSLGSLPDASMHLAALAGVGVDIPLSRSIILFAEGQYTLGLGDVVDNLRAGEEWKTSTLGGVVGIKVGLGGVAAPPPPTVVMDTTTVAEAEPSTNVKAAGVTPGGLSDTVTMESRNVQAAEVHALLPYLFFEKDSATIPARYVQISRTERRSFEANRLERGNTIAVYHNILNIIGQRLREYKSELTIVGSMSRFETDTSLPRRRAEAVRDYISSTWRIPDRKLKLVTTVLPENPSLSEVDTFVAARENQRVTFKSDDPRLLEPVRLLDTAYMAPAAEVRFYPPPLEDSTDIGQWSLDVQVGDSVIHGARTGFGPPPKEIQFNLENRPDLQFERPVAISSRLVLRDTMFMDRATLKSDSVTLVQQGAYHVQRTVEGGNYVETYNLLLFHFDSSAVISFQDEAARIMDGRISPNSTVSVIGHTDEVGLPPYNKKLSLRRAEVALQALNIDAIGAKVDQVVGLGEKQLLYDNDLPEGRYYCRTVTVIIRTPIGPGKEAMGGQSSSK